jgi:hypothetical protein
VAQPYICIQDSWFIHPLRHIYFLDGDAIGVACSLSLARNHTGKFCSFNYIPISFDGFWSYCFGSGKFPISVWPDAHGDRLARSARYRASRIRFSFWRWSSFGDPRKHEMRTLCRAATRSSASLHQRNSRSKLQRRMSMGCDSNLTQAGMYEESSAWIHFVVIRLGHCRRVHVGRPSAMYRQCSPSRANTWLTH